MKKLLMQSDDYGLTDAVSEGIIKAITQGIIRNTGLFVNMDSSQKAADRIKNMDVCLGIDINFVAGKPISPVASIPHLVDIEGHFISSKIQAQKHTLKELQGLVAIFEVDPYPYEEVLLETENQVKKFLELMDRKPEYLHPHSLCTPNTIKAMRTVAQKYGIVFSMDVLEHKDYHYPLDDKLFDKSRSLEEQLHSDKKNQFIETVLTTMHDDEIWLYITHCGYIDYDLFRCSSLTLERMKDLELVTHQEILEWIQNNEIELITYRDLPFSKKEKNIPK